MSIFTRAEEQLNLMGEMMQRTGVDLTKTGGIDHGMFLRSAMANCLHCKATGECKQWMAEDHEQTAAPSFCPNSHRFEDFIASTS